MPRRTPPKPEPHGQCYASAYHFVREEGGILIHGSVRDPQTGRRFPHAWVEKADWIIDAEHLDDFRYLPKERFDRAFQPQIWGQWDADAALMTLARQHHMGPWVDKHGTPAKPKPWNL